MRAYIVRDWCQEPSNFRCEGDLDAFLKSRGIPGLYGIDTRALTRVVREHGVMNGRIACRPDVTRDTLEEIRRYRVTGAVAAVSAGQDSNACWGDGDGPHVVLWDFGAKGNIGRELVRRGCRVTAVPYRTTAEEIEALKPDGLMLSNGPGDPAENPGIIAELKKLGERRLPTFGICLGHQLLALSQGARTIKMKYGNPVSYTHLDGFQGGTGAAPTRIRDNVGIPLELALASVDQRLRDEGIPVSYTHLDVYKRQAWSR